MIIDFHAHTFPDRIAAKALSSLSSKSGVTPVTNGTLSDTLEKMRGWGVDKFVSLNIATNPRQEENVNNFAISIQSDSVIPFGSVHPESEHALAQLEKLKSAGIKGVKFHPEYQEFAIEEARMEKIYQTCSDLGLIVLFHAGYDIGYPDSARCLPENAAKIARKFPDLTIVLAHLGGWRNWDEVETHLMGIDNVYLDTSFLKGYLEPEQCARIIRRHGADHILLGSDCPWQTTQDAISYLEGLGLSREEKELIFSQNAVRILSLS